jgi:hypothetical protein
MPLSLRQTQAAFATALLDTDAAVPGNLTGPGRRRASARFAIYRNNVVVSLVDALHSNFPVTAKLVGEEFFRAMAREYVRCEIPRSPILSQYGGSFPAFIADFAPARQIFYLADVATLEWAWTETYHAADAASLKSLESSDLNERTLLTAGFDLHPSVRFVHSDHPAGTIWLGHQHEPVTAPADWTPERVMLVRSEVEVDLHIIDAGLFAFAQELSCGATVEEAAIRALQEQSLFDPGRGLVRLLKAGALTKLRLSESCGGSTR